MSTSQFCIQQRQKEQQRVKKLLIFGFAGSAVLHGILAYALPRWSFEPQNQAKEPMELIIVDKPKPKPKLKPYASRYTTRVQRPLGKVESKPVVEPKPKPIPPPEPEVRPRVADRRTDKLHNDKGILKDSLYAERYPLGRIARTEAQTPPPPVKPPEPVQAQTPPPKPAPKPPKPKPAPKKVLTTPTPAPSQPIVSTPIEKTTQPSSLSSNFTTPSSSVTSAEASSNSPGVPGSAVATNSAPPRPEASNEAPEGISCVSNCEPEYPAALEGVEGSAGVKLTIDSNGNVIGAELADADSDSQVNRQALLAARQMQFSSPSDDAASVQVKIDFTVEGSQYDRARREEQERQEQAAKKRQEQEAARQQQLEAEQQAQQEQLERERQARQQQLERERQESAPPPTPQAKPSPQPLPALSPEELNEERLRKFQERIENY